MFPVTELHVESLEGEVYIADDELLTRNGGHDAIEGRIIRQKIWVPLTCVFANNTSASIQDKELMKGNSLYPEQVAETWERRWSDRKRLNACIVSLRRYEPVK